MFLLVGGGILIGIGLGYGAARVLSGLFTRESGVVLPVEFAGGDLSLLAILLAISAVLAALPALMAYRQPPAAALRA